MARGKTKMVRITDEKVLKSTFKKRKNGLIKKLQELTILCDIISCVIIYSPIIGGRPPEIFTWPEDQEKVRAAIRMYQEKEEHKQKTAGLCEYLKNKRRVYMSDDDDHHHHQVNNMPMSGADFYERQSNPAEGALAYLNWVDARVKALDQRIEELVKNSGNIMLFGNDQCQNVMFDDKMMVMPVNHQDGNFGYEFFHENPYGNSAQFDPYVYDQSQTICGRGAYTTNPMYMNLVPETIHFQQPTDLNPVTGYQQIQLPNQLRSYDPYLLGMEQISNTMAMSINRGLQYQQQQEEFHGEKIECLSNVTQIQPQCYPLMSGKTDDLTQRRPYWDKWSSPDAASSNYSSSCSNQFHKAAAALYDPVDYFLNAAEFTDEIQQPEDAAGGNISSQNCV